MKKLTTIITVILLLTFITTEQNYSLSFDREDDTSNNSPWGKVIDNNDNPVKNVAFLSSYNYETNGSNLGADITIQFECKKNTINWFYH